MNPIDRMYMNIERLRLVLGETEEAAWLQRAVDSFVYDGKPLEDGFGFKTGATDRSPRWRIIDRQRASLLREALWHCDGNKAALARQIRRYEARVWPLYATRKPPSDWPLVTRSIDAARRLGGPLPTSGQGIGKLIERN